MTRAEGPTLNTLNSAWGPPIFKEFKVSNPDPGRRTNFEQFELGVFKVFKVPPPANVPGLNFENFENDGVTTIFKVFKVSSLGQLAGTGRRNFENSENGGATTIFRVFRGVTGPRPAPVTTKKWRASCAHFKGKSEPCGRRRTEKGPK